jgi:glycosyltransferase involved in cell wall biosynthesis
MTSSVLFPFVGDSLGGSHISALSLIDALPEQGVRSVVGLHQTAGPLAEHLNQRGTPFEALPANAVVSGGGLVREPLRMLAAGRSLAHMLREQNWTVVHTNDARMHLTWAVAARLSGSAHVWHQRTVNPSRRLGLYARLPAKVLTISDYCRAGLPPGMARRATVVDEPVDLPSIDVSAKTAYRERLAAELSIPPSSMFIGFVGNMETQKRPGLFLDLAARLADTDSHFVMVGDTRDFLTANRTTALDSGPLANRVHFTGPRFPILPYMAGFDMLVAPGVREGLGRTVIEAMLLSVPVLAADDGGHRDIVEHGRTGLLARPDDADDFTEKLRSLIEDPVGRAALAGAGHAAVAARYSAQRHAETVAGLYADIAPDIRH